MKYSVAKTIRTAKDLFSETLILKIALEAL